jgi:hypothetical protein
MQRAPAESFLEDVLIEIENAFSLRLKKTPPRRGKNLTAHKGRCDADSAVSKRRRWEGPNKEEARL